MSPMRRVKHASDDPDVPFHALNYNAKIATVTREWLTMEQHPIPRDITGFKFQLIGFMTIKQFGYIVFGAILAFIFFQLPISFLQFPFAALFGFAGIAFAFIPIQERPLEVWVLNMVKSLYAPTQYVWRKENELPSYLAPSTHVVKPPTKKQEELARQALLQQHDTRKKLEQYLRTIQPRQEEILNTRERGGLDNINSLFQEGVTTSAIALQQGRMADQTAFVQPQEPVRQMPTDTRRYMAPALPHGIIAGLIRDSDMALPGMLIHIMDNQNKQTRLFKSNVAGKFSSAIALPAGTYNVTIEDPTRRYTFSPFPFMINGEGVRPWLIMPASNRTH